MVDALFLPYIRSIHMSMSMILLMGWTIFHLPLLFDTKVFQIVAGISILAIISTIKGIVEFPQYLSDNIVNLVTILFCLLYYVFFYVQIVKRSINVLPVFYFHIIFSAIFAMYYLVSPQGYFNLRSIWTMSGTKITYYGALYNRFTFLQSDPNNNACIVCAMMLYIFLNEKNINSTKKIMLFVLVGISVFTSISTTGFVVYFISIGAYVITTKWYIFKRYVNPINVCLAMMILTMLVTIAGVILTDRTHFSIDLLGAMKERFALTTSGGTMSGRTDIWSEIAKSFDIYKYIMIGNGGTLLDRNAKVHLAHNGHIHMVLAYGMIAYVLFIYLYFRKPKGSKWREYIPMIPLFLVFSVNTLVIDFRASIALSVVAAVYHSYRELSTVPQNACKAYVQQGKQYI